MNAPQPRVYHSVCRQSGLHELWIMCGDAIIAGPAPMPPGWVSIFNKARQEALDVDAGIESPREAS